MFNIIITNILGAINSFEIGFVDIALEKSFYPELTTRYYYRKLFSVYS